MTSAFVIVAIALLVCCLLFPRRGENIAASEHEQSRPDILNWNAAEQVTSWEITKYYSFECDEACSNCGHRNTVFILKRKPVTGLKFQCSECLLECVTRKEEV